MKLIYTSYLNLRQETSPAAHQYKTDHKHFNVATTNFHYFLRQ